jgi:hypothetical protein
VIGSGATASSPRRRSSTATSSASRVIGAVQARQPGAHVGIEMCDRGHVLFGPIREEGADLVTAVAAQEQVGDRRRVDD